MNFARDPFSVELREVPVPAIGDHDVLLRVGAVSVCGSDLHQWRGSHSWPVNYPCILGPRVLRHGGESGLPLSNGFREGDRVVSETAAVIDETSPLSRGGLYNLDPTRRGFGYGVDGAMTEYVRVPARCLHRIPDHLPFRKRRSNRALLRRLQRSLRERPRASGRHRTGVGPGPDWLAVRQMAKLSGAGHVIVAGLPSDQLPFRSCSFSLERMSRWKAAWSNMLRSGATVWASMLRSMLGRFGHVADGAPSGAAGRSDHQGRLGAAAVAVQPGSAGSEERDDVGKLLAQLAGLGARDLDDRFGADQSRTQS